MQYPPRLPKPYSLPMLTGTGVRILSYVMTDKRIPSSDHL
jgi:hypothetical protein